MARYGFTFKVEMANNDEANRVCEIAKTVLDELQIPANGPKDTYIYLTVENSTFEISSWEYLTTVGCDKIENAMLLSLMKEFGNQAFNGYSFSECCISSEGYEVSFRNEDGTLTCVYDADSEDVEIKCPSCSETVHTNIFLGDKYNLLEGNKIYFYCEECDEDTEISINDVCDPDALKKPVGIVKCVIDSGKLVDAETMEEYKPTFTFFEMN